MLQTTYSPDIEHSQYNRLNLDKKVIVISFPNKEIFLDFCSDYINDVNIREDMNNIGRQIIQITMNER
jgi:hypothetical protein